MDEVPISVVTYLIEAGILSSGTLGFLLWRACRDRRALRSRVAELEDNNKEPIPPAPPVEMASPLVSSAAAVDVAGQEEQGGPAESEKFTEIFKANETMQGVIEQLREQNTTLRQQVEQLVKQAHMNPEVQQTIVRLQTALQDVEEKLEFLELANTQLKYDLRDRSRELTREQDELELAAQRLTLQQNTMRELRKDNAHLMREVEKKDRLLQSLQDRVKDYQDMKQEMWDLKSKLTKREADFQQLQAEFDNLSVEYHRLFEDFQT